MNLEELITSVALNVVEAYIHMAGQVLKCTHDEDLVEKVCQDMITSVRQRVRGTKSTTERGTPPSRLPTRECEPSA
jgi:hypothetical protein